MNIASGAGHFIAMHRPSWLSVWALMGALVSLAPQGAHAEYTLHQSAFATSFDRPFAMAAYATGWEGTYGGAGLGGRLRWEMFPRLGLEVFGEALLVQSTAGLRHDHPIGFNLFVPFRFGERFRLRPLLGLCAVLSFIDSSQPNAPGANDVLLGVHAGVGAEVALSEGISLFAEAQAVAWAGHDRAVQGWTGAVGNELKPFVVGQAFTGLSLHFGKP